MIKPFVQLGVCAVQTAVCCQQLPTMQAGRQSSREATQAHMAAACVSKQDMPLSACLLCTGVVSAGLAAKPKLGDGQWRAPAVRCRSLRSWSSPDQEQTWQQSRVSWLDPGHHLQACCWCVLAMFWEGCSA